MPRINNEATDEEVAKMVQEGDADAFGLLVERYEKKLLRYGKKFLLGREDAEDLVQEVFLKAYSNIRSFDISRRFSPWIYRIAHNEFVNAIKKKPWENFFSLDIVFPHPVAEETADEKAVRRELKEYLDKFLSELSPKYREPLILFYYEEKNYIEIAEILQIPVSTVGVRLIRGRDILKRLSQKIKYKI